MADDLQRKVIEIILQAKNAMGEGLASAAADMAGLESLAKQKAQSLHTLGIGMAAAGAGMMAVGAGALEIGKSAVESAGHFQELTTALVTGAGESRDVIGSVSKGMLDMAGQVGVGANDLAKGMYMIESAGYHGADGLAVLEASAKGARIGMADQAVVADALTTVLKDYHLSGQDAAGVTGQMTAAVAAGKMHWEDFAGSLSKVLPIAAGLNIPFQQVAAAEAVMTAHGVDAARAATAIQAGLMQLVHPSKNAQAAIKDLGIPLDELQAKLASGNLQGALQMFSEAMANKLPESAKAAMAEAQKAFAEGMDPEQAFAALEEKVGPAYSKMIADVVGSFGGVRGGALALNLLPNMDEYRADIQSIGTVSQGAAKSQEAWALVQEDLNFKFEAAKAGRQSTSITLGTALIPVVRSLLDAITPVVQGLSQWISQNPDLAAGILTATVAIGLIGGAIMIAAGAMTVLNAASAPVVLVILGIAAAIAAGIYIWTHWGEITQWLGDRLGDLGQWIGNAIKWVGNLLDSLGPFADFLLYMLGPIGWVIEAFRHWDQIVAIVQRVWTVVQTTTQAALNFVENTLIRPALSAISTAWASAWGAAQTTFSNAWTTITADAKTGVNAVITLLDDLIRNWNSIEFRIPGFDVSLPSVDVPGVGTIGGGHLGWGGLDVRAVQLPLIPTLDTGAIVNRPTLAALAMNNVPEAVIPLPQLGRQLAGFGAGGGMTVNITIPISNSTITNRAALEELADALAVKVKQKLDTITRH